MQKAANRIVGDAPTLQDQLILGKFAPIGSVIWLYLGGNHLTLLKHFSFLLALLVAYAVMLLLDERFSWFYGTGPDRRKLQGLALACLASFAAPLSWFVLAKGHSFDHLPIDLILWYVPTIPLGCAMFAVASDRFREHAALKRGDAVRSWLVASVPSLIVGIAIGILYLDRRIETTGTWVISEHGYAAPIFESTSLGTEFRMTNDWFTVLYPCPVDPDDTRFVIRAEQDGATIAYDFPMARNQVFASKGKCIAPQAKSDRPVSRIHFGEVSSKGLIWERDATISLPDHFTPDATSDADWDRGINRASGTEVLVADEDFGRLLIKKGDEVLISPTDRRTIMSITSVGLSKLIALDGTPIHLEEGVVPVFGIVRR
jgi:hypothetical protein